MELPFDIFVRIYNILSISDLKKYRLLSRSHKDVSFYETSSMVHVRGPIQKWKRVFPKIHRISLKSRSDVTDEDIQDLNYVHSLDIYRCLQLTLSTHVFKSMHSLRELYLEGCCSYWGRKMNNDIFDELTQLTRFSIDNNHFITDEVLSKLNQLTYLYIHNCPLIGNAGLCTMKNLTELDMYHIDNITNDVFVHLPNLTHLKITFGNITTRGILHLPKLTSLSLVGAMINCEHIDTLPRLKYLSVAYGPIADEHMKYLCNVPEISFYGCDRIHGAHFDDLTKVESLSMYELPLDPKHLGTLCKLTNVKKINMYRCRTITQSSIDSLSIPISYGN